ncbi:MAG: helix-turn-helix domain-containing protein [Eggerthellaceae bacterium]|nr:helix-turn-helix domain-containing protein [Eggerthellaceae bacterium]
MGTKADIIKALSAITRPLSFTAISNSIGLGKTKTNELIRELVESGHVIAEGAARSRRYRLSE